MTDVPPPPPPPQQTAPEAPHVTDVDVLRRLRIVEERFLNLRRKAQLVDEKLLSAEDKLHTELRSMTSELVSMRRAVADLRESVNLARSEMANAASQYELKALEKYLNYWQPLNFVTQEELLRKTKFLKERPGRSGVETVR
jgi:hypothetical protein